MADLSQWLRDQGQYASAGEVDRLRRVEECARKVVFATYSHVDGRDLLAEIHPRKSLDIIRRRDSVETRFEADWLTSLYDAIKPLRVYTFHPPRHLGRIDESKGAVAQGIEAGTAKTGTGSVHESPVAESEAPERSVIPVTTVKGETL